MYGHSKHMVVLISACPYCLSISFLKIVETERPGGVCLCVHVVGGGGGAQPKQ